MSYAQLLLAATPADMLLSGTKAKKVEGLTIEQTSKMERKMNNVQEQYKLREETYGYDVLRLRLAKGYLGELIGNLAVHRYLKKHQPDMLAEFEVIVQSVGIAG